MKIRSKSDLTFEEKEFLCQLWNKEYPEKLAYNSVAEFESYLNNFSDINHSLFCDASDEIQGWAITFTRENEKWFAIIINSKIQSKGFGSQLLNHLKSKENQLSGWVIDHNYDLKLDGTSYVSPLNFYLKNGFSVLQNVRIETEKIAAVKIVWNK